METNDVIMIGGGHNALVCAAYLTRAGKSVLVVERNDRPGGFVRTDEIMPACDQCARAVWQLRSTHRTSAGAVGYARCPCGAWLVLLDGRPLATARPRPRAATPSSRRPSSPSRPSPLNPVRAVVRAITRILAAPNGGPS